MIATFHICLLFSFVCFLVVDFLVASYTQRIVLVLDLFFIPLALLLFCYIVDLARGFFVNPVSSMFLFAVFESSIAAARAYRFIGPRRAVYNNPCSFLCGFLLS